jgi:colanic acid biosynthesis glycosyl transferase WcaI
MRGLSGALGAAVRSLRDWSLRSAARTVAIGESMADYLRGRRGVPSERVVVIHNFADDSLIRPIEQQANLLLSEWEELSGRFVIGYSGNMGRVHDFATVIEAMHLLRDHSSLIFLFTGGGTQKASLEDLVAKNGLESLAAIRPYQPQERLGMLLGCSNVHLVTMRPEFEGLAVPSKFYGVLAAGRPCVFVGHPQGELARLIQKYDCGMVVRIGDACALAHALLSLHNDTQLAKRLGANARETYLQHFQAARAVSRWGSVIDGLCGNGGNDPSQPPVVHPTRSD